MGASLLRLCVGAEEVFYFILSFLKVQLSCQNIFMPDESSVRIIAVQLNQTEQ